MYSGLAGSVTYYMLMAPRIAANTKVASFYSNNNLTRNKREVMRMPNFNRKFLPEEIEQFLHNENVQNKGRKRYIYNSEVHGDDEEAFKKVFERMNSGKHKFTKEMKLKIRELNQSKLDNDEAIRMVPWNVTSNIN